MGLFDSIFAGGGIGGFNPFGLFGETDQGVKAKTAQQNATGLQGQSANLYNTLAQQGAQTTQQGNQLLPGILAQFMAATGTGNAAQGGNMQKNPPGAKTADGQMQSPASGQTQMNPYALDPAQQTQLNQQTNQLMAQKQAANATLQAQFAAKGFSDPAILADAQQLINSHYDNQIQSVTADFAQQALQQKVTSLGVLMNLATGMQGMGAQETGQAASGIGSLAGAAQQNAQYQQGLANDQSAQGLELLGAAFGFGTGGGTKKDTYTKDDVIRATGGF